MDSKNRRTILKSLTALLAAPIVLGRDALAHVLVPKPKDRDDRRLPHIVPPAHSVKRRG
jgi:hypothetical protein